MKRRVPRTAAKLKSRSKSQTEKKLQRFITTRSTALIWLARSNNNKMSDGTTRKRSRSTFPNGLRKQQQVSHRRRQVAGLRVLEPRTRSEKRPAKSGRSRKSSFSPAAHLSRPLDECVSLQKRDIRTRYVKSFREIKMPVEFSIGSESGMCGLLSLFRWWCNFGWFVVCVDMDRPAGRFAFLVNCHNI